MSFGFADPSRSRKNSRAVRRHPTFSATAAAMNWLSETPSLAANSAAAFLTEVGSFKGLNEHWFQSLADARSKIAAWRIDYNQNRPHSALEDLTPAEFAAAWRSRHAGTALLTDEMR